MGGRFSIILFIVASNPKSKHRSASSSTKIWRKKTDELTETNTWNELHKNRSTAMLTCWQTLTFCHLSEDKSQNWWPIKSIPLFSVINMYLGETECEDVIQTVLAQDRVQWQIYLYTEMNYSVSQKHGISWPVEKLWIAQERLHHVVSYFCSNAMFPVDVWYNAILKEFWGQRC